MPQDSQQQLDQAQAPPLPDEEIFLGRQPILDRKGNLAAYELLFRSGNVNSASFADGSVATATVINHAFANLGLEAVLGGHRGFINFDEDLLMSDLVELLPKDKIVIELLETITITDAIIERVRSIKQQGYMLALDDYVGDEAEKAVLFPLIDIVKVEIPGFTPDQLKRASARLHCHRVRLLAEKVDTHGQVDSCMQLGFELFQGYYFAKPSVISGRQVSPSAKAIMRLTGLVVGDAETDEIDQVFRENPDLTVSLLRVVNSVAIGARQRITSVKHALVVLGRNQLNRWLQILMYALGDAAGVTHPSPLTILATTRGRLMEALSVELDSAESALRERAFMVGILSLTDALLGIPLTEILQSLPVAADVKSALLERCGRLGELLALTQALETMDPAAIRIALAPFPELLPETVNRAQVEAMKWATSLGQQIS